VLGQPDVAAVFGVMALNRELYAFFFRQRGLLFACACIPLHLLYYLYSGLSYFYVWIRWKLCGAGMGRSSPVKEGEGVAAQTWKGSAPR